MLLVYTEFSKMPSKFIIRVEFRGKKVDLGINCAEVINWAQTVARIAKKEKK